MEVLTDYLVPVILLLASGLALRKKENSYALLLEGGAEGLRLLKDILPTLIMLLTAVELFRSSGAAELLQRFLSPVFSFLGIPVECALLVLVRPISGSAALAVATDLMGVYGVDSRIGRTAAIMLGSTETTFYTISVYFGAAGIRRSRYTLPAALFADLVGFTAAAWTAKFMNRVGG